MKKTINILLVTLLLTGVSTIPVNAEETGQTIYWNNGIASTTPPTPEESTVAGFAVVDNEGVVKGVIACNTNYCPTVLEGTFMDCTNCKLVQQTPASTDGNAVGFVNTPEIPVTYDLQTNLFTLGTGSTLRSEVVDSTTISVTINSEGVVFNPTTPITPKVTPTTGATISATDGLIKEMAVFETPKTRAQLQANIQGKLALIERYLNRFYTLLNGWLID
jgi:hypothetical protein